MSSVTSLNSTASVYPTGRAASLQQLKSDFQSLSGALQSGDLSSAQQAFAAVRSDIPELFPYPSSPISSSTIRIENVLAKLSTALASGNLSGAQKAFAALESPGHRPQDHDPRTSAADAASAEDASPSAGHAVAFGAVS
jgi:hypothetical protein